MIATLVTAASMLLVAQDRPGLAWPPAEDAQAYYVRLRSFTGRELWQARTTAPHLAYPEGKDPLRRGLTYQWEVTYRDSNDRFPTLVQPKFSVAWLSELGQMEEIRPLAVSEDRADLLAAALAYHRLVKPAN
jgi:hypothetical protein